MQPGRGMTAQQRELLAESGIDMETRLKSGNSWLGLFLLAAHLFHSFRIPGCKINVFCGFVSLTKCPCRECPSL